jgi:UDP-N-acetylglucosamine--N-acetylmuramyl-(pentapeptide) pyrophosphoryl-undecaprenol N-acetylglucosamine transferase
MSERQAMPRHIMIMAAGTGGHIFPGLAVARQLLADGLRVSWLGTPHGLENRIVPATGIELDRIEITGLRGRGLLGWLAAPVRVWRAMRQARAILKRRRPDCVLSMGGYVAGPGGLVARWMRIPLVLHEQNAIAGLTNRWLRPFARRVLSGFPAVLKGAEQVGNPVRDEIAALPHPRRRYLARQGPLRILIVGGSQGALAFASKVPQALALLPKDKRPRVLHQAGRQLDATRQAYEEAGVDGEVVEFIDDMASAWGEADLAICRAGALTVAELAAAGVASLLVPFPAAVDDHQTANARYLSEASAAWLVAQNELTPEGLAERLGALNRLALAEMAERARGLARPDATAAVARACQEAAA